MVVAAGGVNDEKEDEDRSKLEKEEEEIILCSKTDKKGWQCGERVKNGHSFCEHHLPKRKTHGNNSAHSKKPEENPRRPRPRKPATSSNPYEFYYYSGFGPRWGRKRGSEAAGRTGRTTTAVVKQEPYSSSPESGSTGSSSDTSSTSKNTTIIEDAADNEGPKASDSTTTTPEPKILKVSAFSEFVNQGIDYVEDGEDDEDYDDDDDEENGEIGKKRARKPIKARSLKSLM